MLSQGTAERLKGTGIRKPYSLADGPLSRSKTLNLLQIKVTCQEYKILIIKKQLSLALMIGQKRMKTQGYEIRDVSDKKQRKEKNEKTAQGSRQHKQSEIHLKSVSKDITPKKHSIVQKSKYKESFSGNKMLKSKQLTSVCSYSAIEKQSIPATKRKASNARSVKKKFSKNKQQIHQSLKSTVSNFSILTKCLTEYIKEEKKKGNDPGMQILHLIKAFNKSEVAPLSKELQLLISNMLDYIEDTVGGKDLETNNERPHGLKSRSSFSSASDREVVYSQILENSVIPSTVKKPYKESSMEVKLNEAKVRSCESEESDGEESKEQVEEKEVQGSNKKINKELEVSLKRDLKNMHDQLYQLRSAGQKLQFKADSQHEEKKKFEELFKKNQKIIESMTQKNTRNLQLPQANRRTDPNENESQEEDENY